MCCSRVNRPTVLKEQAVVTAVLHFGKGSFAQAKRACFGVGHEAKVEAATTMRGRSVPPGGAGGDDRQPCWFQPLEI
jgi:hypothetical protein